MSVYRNPDSIWFMIFGSSFTLIFKELLKKNSMFPDETVTLVATPPDSGQPNNANYTGDFSVRSVSSDEGVDVSEPQVTNRAVGSGTAAGNGKRMRSKTVIWQIRINIFHDLRIWKDDVFYFIKNIFFLN